MNNADIEDHPTLKDAVHIFLYEFKLGSGVKSRTLDNYKYMLNRSVQRLGHLKVNQITTPMIQKMLNDMLRKEGFERRTVNGTRFALDHFYRHYIKINKNNSLSLNENPVEGTELEAKTRKVKEKRSNRALSPEERSMVLNRAKEESPLHYAVITTLMLTGMRVGELTALQWGHVDFKDSTITIEVAATYEDAYDNDGNRISRESVVDITKTFCSERVIKAPNAVMDCLSEWRKHLAAESGKMSRHSFVFPGQNGEMRCYTSMGLLVRRFAERIGMKGKLKPHALRHTCATILLEQGVSARIVQEYLGHAEVRTTLGTYSDVLKGVMDGAANELDNVYENIFSDDPDLGRKSVQPQKGHVANVATQENPDEIRRLCMEFFQKMGNEIFTQNQ